jgi:predicted phosphoribosyltransferase
MQTLFDGFARSIHGHAHAPLRDRKDAGEKLVQRLNAYAGREDVVVVGLPRGGVPVAYEIAAGLGVPLDILVVRKLGVPGQEELAMGAIASSGGRVLNREIVDTLLISDEVIEAASAREQQEITRRLRAYRGDKPPLNVQGKTVILTDDGVATGATLAAALAALRMQQPAKIIVAVGVAPPESCQEIAKDADELICLYQPDPFIAVGIWFADFSPTTDEEVRTLLAQAEFRLHNTKASRVDRKEDERANE